MALIDQIPSSESYCYVTTTGRRSGNPHTIETWFGLTNDTLYILAGGARRSDTVRNVMRDPDVRVRIGSTTFTTRARVLEASAEEDKIARRLILEKYTPGYTGSLDSWGRTALAVAFDITAVVSTDMGDALWPKGRRLGGLT